MNVPHMLMYTLHELYALGDGSANTFEELLENKLEQYQVCI